VTREQAKFKYRKSGVPNSASSEVGVLDFEEPNGLFKVVPYSHNDFKKAGDRPILIGLAGDVNYQDVCPETGADLNKKGWPIMSGFPLPRPGGFLPIYRLSLIANAM
jgi:hypothetical protein